MLTDEQLAWLHSMADGSFWPGPAGSLISYEDMCRHIDAQAAELVSLRSTCVALHHAVCIRRDEYDAQAARIAELEERNNTYAAMVEDAGQDYRREVARADMQTTLIAELDSKLRWYRARWKGPRPQTCPRGGYHEPSIGSPACHKCGIAYGDDDD
jgi:hypothetical protein